MAYKTVSLLAICFLALICSIETVDGRHRSLLDTNKSNVTKRDRGEDHRRPGGTRPRPHNDDDENENEDDNASYNNRSPSNNVSPAAVTPAAPISTSCALTFSDTSTNFTNCQNIASGQSVYYSLNGTTLSVGYKLASSGWASWALGRSMIGASGVFTQSCGTDCTKPYTALMNGYSVSQFTTTNAFGNVKVGRASDGALIGSFTMNWPSTQSSLTYMLAVGDMTSGGSMNQHRGTPRRYTLQRSTLKSA